MPTTASAAEIRNDFDTIARLLPADGRPGPHEADLLANLPVNRGTALEVGCGAGALARRIAASFDRVIGIDLSPAMIAEARRRAPADAAINFVVADMFDWLEQHDAQYDCIVSIATLHHVDLAAALRAMRRSLKPGGRLLVLDLIDRSGARYFITNAIAFLRSRVRARLSLKLRQAYLRHGRNESYLTISEVRAVVGEELPGAAVCEHLMWRYSIVWDKPSVQ